MVYLLQRKEEMNTYDKNIIYEFPSLGLLRKPKCEKIDFEILKETARIIKQTLLNAGVRVLITDINIGTRFMRYEILPEIGVRIKDITRQKMKLE